MYTFKSYDVDSNILYKKVQKKILIAISGGQDSLYLIQWLENYTLIKENILCISYIYIDHQWKQDSKKQIKHIINYIKSFAGKIYVYQFREILGSENMCRIYRYSILLKHATIHGYNTIITGHNKTDKTETFLLHFFKGYGLEGITTLTSQVELNYKIQLLRPLLSINRHQIYWICKKFYLPIWSDKSNYIYLISRNRIRNELIPYLKKYFHQNIENNINYLLHSYYTNHEYVKQNTIKLYLDSIHNIYIAINYLNITKQHLNIQFKVLQLFWFHNINKNINFQTIINIILHIHKKNKTNLEIKVKHITLNINKKWIYITSKQIK